MKKLILLLLLMTFVPVMAKDPLKKGYKVEWVKNAQIGFERYTCYIKQFSDNDSLCYITYTAPQDPPYCLRFSFMPKTTAEELINILDGKGKFERKKWMRGYINYTHAADINAANRYNEYWTFFRPTAQERHLVKDFTLAAAIYAYHKDRDKHERWRNITPEQWLALFETAKVVLPLMGGEGDGRTLYDKIMQDGGY